MSEVIAASALGLPWRRALVRAAATVWLPTLAPVVTGMLSGCGHCATNYWLSLLLFALTALLLRELPGKAGYAAQAIVALAVAFESVGIAAAMRA